MTTVAFAGHPLITDDTGTQGKGGGQVEIGLSFCYDKDDVDEKTTLKSDGGDLTVEITVRILETLDVVLGLPYAWNTFEENDVRIERAEGIADISFDVKWRFFEKDGWSLALKPGFNLPAGDEDKGLGAGRAGYRLFLVGTREFEPVAIHVNAGYVRSENTNEERKDLWHVSAACEYGVSNELKFLANIGMERNSDSASTNHPAFALGGISYNVTENMTLDAGVKYGLSSTETDWTYLAGLAIRF